MDSHNKTDQYISLTQKAPRFIPKMNTPKQGLLNLDEIVFEGRIDLNNVARSYALQGDLGRAQQILGRIQSDLNPNTYDGTIREPLYDFAKNECVITLGILDAVRNPGDYSVSKAPNRIHF